ncbi:hypothetical protein [Synechococcus sp. BL107]|nr:hypothetical protein [Synechococcus sp. BL107]
MFADALPSAAMGGALQSEATVRQDAFGLVELRTLEFVSPI